MSKAIKGRIIFLRDLMEKLIEQKDNLLDPEVIKISQELDGLLNEYNMHVLDK